MIEFADGAAFSQRPDPTENHPITRADRELARLVKQSQLADLLELAHRVIAVSDRAAHRDAWYMRNELQALSVQARAAIKKLESPAKATSGVCRFCGCTEERACNPPCSWVDKNRTICSSVDCMARGRRDGLLKKNGGAA